MTQKTKYFECKLKSGTIMKIKGILEAIRPLYFLQFSDGTETRGHIEHNAIFFDKNCTGIANFQKFFGIEKMDKTHGINLIAGEKEKMEIWENEIKIEREKEEENAARQRGTFWIVTIGGDSHIIAMEEAYQARPEDVEDYREEYREKVFFGFPGNKKQKISFQAFSQFRKMEKNLDGGWIVGNFYGDVARLTDEQAKLLIEIEHRLIEKKTQNELQKKNQETKKIEELTHIATATGKKQELYHYSVDCDDPNEECSVDMIYVYIMPDGTQKSERSHTY